MDEGYLRCLHISDGIDETSSKDYNVARNLIGNRWREATVTGGNTIGGANRIPGEKKLDYSSSNSILVW